MDDHTLEDTIGIVIKIADRESFTPLGLFDYLYDLQHHADAYGSELIADRIVERIVGGTRLRAEDITHRLASLASHFHHEKVKDMVRAWQAEADEKNVPVSSIIAAQEAL